MWRFRIGIASLALLALGAGGCAAGYTEYRPVRAEPGRVVDVSVFYDALSPYGQWFQYGDYGWAWTPYDMPPGWRPYTTGHWAYTDCGWTWVSDQPWGWAPFHYGRWAYDDDYGWVWIPDTVWGPAWVAWRDGDEDVGWAPLPPAARWDVSVGITSGGADVSAHAWSFVPRRNLCDPRLGGELEPAPRNETLIGATRVLDIRYEPVNGRPMDRGVDVDDWERRDGRRAPRFKLADLPQPTGRGAVESGGRLSVFRPQVAPVASAPPPHTPAQAPPPPDPAVAAHRAERERQYQNYWDAQRRRLDASHQQELARTPDASARQQLEARHAAETQALEAQIQRERHVVEARAQHKVMKPPPGRGRQEDRGRGGHGDQGDHGGHGDHGDHGSP